MTGITWYVVVIHLKIPETYFVSRIHPDISNEFSSNHHKILISSVSIRKYIFAKIGQFLKYFLTKSSHWCSVSLKYVSFYISFFHLIKMFHSCYVDHKAGMRSYCNAFNFFEESGVNYIFFFCFWNFCPFIYCFM